jgi:hypothetical protein
MDSVRTCCQGLFVWCNWYIAMRAVVYDYESAGGSEAVMKALDDRLSLILSLLGIGLGGYAFWRFEQVLVDPEHREKPLTLQSVVQRCGYAFSGLSYLGIGYSAGLLTGGNRVFCTTKGIRERFSFVKLQIGIKALPEKLNSSVIIWTTNGDFIRRDVVPFPSHRNLQKLLVLNISRQIFFKPLAGKPGDFF